jgi:hypothetical protein
MRPIHVASVFLASVASLLASATDAHAQTFRSSSNYTIGNPPGTGGNCPNLKNIKVTMHVTDDLVAGPSSTCGEGVNGFSVQLNATAPNTITPPYQAQWQQYVIEVGQSSVVGGLDNLTAHTQLWADTPGQGPGPNNPPDAVIPAAPIPNTTLPAGYTLTWTLATDSNGIVNTATYSVTDSGGNTSSYPQELSSTLAQWAAPIVSYQLDIVGQPGCGTTFVSGAGIITYSTSTPFTAMTGLQSCAGSTLGTGETSNSSYGPMNVGLEGNTFQQTFQIHKWNQLPTGCATSIGAGDGTSPWITGCDVVDNDKNNAILYWDSLSSNSDKWLRTSTGSGIEIAAMYIGDYTNMPLLVDNAGKIYYGEPGGGNIESSTGTNVSWNRLPAQCGTSISGSHWTGGIQTNTPYVTGCAPVSGGYTPAYELNGLATGWTPLSGEAGVRISASNDGTELWMVDSGNNLYSYDFDADTWSSEPGGAVDVSAGSGLTTFVNRPPWAVGLKNDLYQWAGNAWAPVNGGPKAKRVSIGSNGTVWVIDTNGNIWFYN